MKPAKQVTRHIRLAREFLLQRLQCEQVVAKDQSVVEDVIIAHPMLSMISLLRILQQNTRLQPRPISLADTG